MKTVNTMNDAEVTQGYEGYKSRSVRSVAVVVFATLAIMAVIAVAGSATESNHPPSALQDANHVQRMLRGGGMSPVIIDQIVNYSGTEDFMAPETFPSWLDDVSNTSAADFMAEDDAASWGDVWANLIQFLRLFMGNK